MQKKEYNIFFYIYINDLIRVATGLIKIVGVSMQNLFSFHVKGGLLFTLVDIQLV